MLGTDFFNPQSKDPSLVTEDHRKLKEGLVNQTCEDFDSYATVLRDIFGTGNLKVIMPQGIRLPRIEAGVGRYCIRVEAVFNGMDSPIWKGSLRPRDSAITACEAQILNLPYLRGWLAAVSNRIFQQGMDELALALSINNFMPTLNCAPVPDEVMLCGFTLEDALENLTPRVPDLMWTEKNGGQGAICKILRGGVGIGLVGYRPTEPGVYSMAVQINSGKIFGHENTRITVKHNDVPTSDPKGYCAGLLVRALWKTCRFAPEKSKALASLRFTEGFQN
jgi:hypothetical protein